MPSPVDPWSPEQYDRFKAERQAPFHDLLALVRPAALRSAVDLGCGTGELTAVLHRRLAPAATLGLDSSAAMLASAAAFASPGLTFALGRLERWQAPAPVDLIFSNAAVQWCADHEELLARWRRNLAPGGQLAVQMPANHDHPSHRLAAEVAGEAPFAAALAGYVRRSPVLPVEAYAALLHRLGFRHANVQLRVYGHPLASSAAVVEWVKGTLLTDYAARLAPAVYAAFVARYGARLAEALGEGPYFYAFKRILMWAEV